MTVKVKALKDITRRTRPIKAGTTIETAKDIAETWVNAGLAEYVVETKKPIDIPKAIAKEKAAESK